LLRAPGEDIGQLAGPRWRLTCSAEPVTPQNYTTRGCWVSWYGVVWECVSVCVQERGVVLCVSVYRTLYAICQPRCVSGWRYWITVWVDGWRQCHTGTWLLVSWITRAYLAQKSSGRFGVV